MQLIIFNSLFFCEHERYCIEQVTIFVVIYPIKPACFFLIRSLEMLSLFSQWILRKQYHPAPSQPCFLYLFGMFFVHSMTDIWAFHYLQPCCSSTNRVKLVIWRTCNITDFEVEFVFRNWMQRLRGTVLFFTRNRFLSVCKQVHFICKYN